MRETLEEVNLQHERGSTKETLCDELKNITIKGSVMGSVEESASALATLDRKRRKRKSNLVLSPDIIIIETPTKRSNREEEKENRKKSTSPPSSVVKSVKSPRRRLRVSQAIKEPVVRRRRKAENPKSLTELQAAAAGYQSADKLLSSYLSVPKSSLQSNVFLCRNVRNRYLKKDEEENGYHYQQNYDQDRKRIDFALLKTLKVNAMKKTGERPVFTIQFEKILDWTDTIENDFVNELTSTSTISFTVVVVDNRNKMHKFPGGFAVAPLYKQCEENKSEVELARLLTLKLRQFTCSQELLNSTSEIYMIVETSRLMSKEVHTIIKEGKRRRTIAPPNPSSLSDDVNDYVSIKRYGCARLYRIDPKNGELACTEGVTRITLLENGYEGINLDNDGEWKDDLDNLQKLDAPNRKPCQGRDARLIISTVGHAVVRRISPKKSPRKSKILNGKMSPRPNTVSYSFVGTKNSELSEKLKSLQIASFQCPITLRSFPTLHLFETHLKIRFPCFEIDIERCKIEKNVEFFDSKKSKLEQYENFSFRKPGTSTHHFSTPIPVTNEIMDVGEEDDEGGSTPGSSKYGILAPEVLPCSSLKFVKRFDWEEVVVKRRKSDIQTRAKSESPKKKSLRSPRKREKKMVMREAIVPRENSRLINGMRLLKERASKYAYHQSSKGSFKVLNTQLPHDKIAEYRNKQKESMDDVKKEENKKRKKKGSKKAGILKKSGYNMNPEVRQFDSDVEEHLPRPARNGGMELDMEGFPIPVPAYLRFDEVIRTKYNMMLRRFYANYGQRQSSSSFQRKSNMMTSLIEAHYPEIFSHNLSRIYLKHIQFMFFDEKNPAYYFKPFNRFLELRKVHSGR